MPFQFGIGSARNWNLRPATGSKSLFIIHCASSGLSVSARHSFSGGWGNTLSTTRVRGLSAGLVFDFWDSWVFNSWVMASSSPVSFRADQTGPARRRHRDYASPPSEPAHRALRDSESRVA